MARKRVYQVAKDFHVSSEAMLKMLREMKVEVKSHMSSIDEELIEEIRKKFDAEKKIGKQAQGAPAAFAEEGVHGEHVARTRIVDLD